MNKTFISIVVVFVVVAAALVFQATRTGTSHVLLPSEVAAIASSGADRSRIRVGGRVAASEVEYTVEPRIELKFRVENPGTGSPESIAVFYPGIKPDMFAAGRDVIIDGDLKGGVLVASKLQTQCPSKYEPPPVDKMYPQQ